MAKKKKSPKKTLENGIRELPPKARNTKIPKKSFHRTLTVRYQPSFKKDRAKLEKELKEKFSHLTIKNQVHRSTIAKWVVEYAEECVEEFIKALEKGNPAPRGSITSLSDREIHERTGMAVQISSDGGTVIYTKDKRI